MGFCSEMFDIFLNWTRRFSWTGYKKPESFFTVKELHGLKDDFIQKLVAARQKTIELDPEKRGIPFRISSGYRTPDENKSIIGGIPNSAHLKGLAVDLRVYSSREAKVIVEAAFLAGITRVGYYVDIYDQPIHLHLDIDPEKVSDVLFVQRELN